MGKFTLNLTDGQEKLIDELREPLDATTRAEVFRKALALAKLYAEIRSKEHELVVIDKSGVPVERVRLL